MSKPFSSDPSSTDPIPYVNKADPLRLQLQLLTSSIPTHYVFNSDLLHLQFQLITSLIPTHNVSESDSLRPRVRPLPMNGHGGSVSQPEQWYAWEYRNCKSPATIGVTNARKKELRRVNFLEAVWWKKRYTNKPRVEIA